MTVVFVGVDYSEASKDALAWANIWNKVVAAPKGQLIIGHVVETANRPLAQLSPNLRGDSINDSLKDNIRNWASKVIIAEDVAAIKVGMGNPAHELNAMAHEVQADWMVISATGRQGMSKWVVGSTAERLANHPPCRLIVKHPRPFTWNRQTTITVATDFSPTANRATTEMLAIANKLKAQVNIVHIVEEPRGIPFLSAATPEQFQMAKQIADQKMNALKESLNADIGEATIAFTILTGRVAAQELISFVKSSGTDILTLGAKGDSAWSDFWMGSMTSAIVKQMPCTLSILPA